MGSPLRWLFALSLLLGLAACGKKERCDDRDDNDGDGFVDCSDQDCAVECGEVCGNGVDDNNNGRVDCEDAACKSECNEDCTNGEDDDGDLLSDCADPDCFGGSCTEVCSGGLDDDGDWLVDCEDSDCATTCDADFDGFISASLGGDDCDDGDADAFPGGTEVPYDGSNNDCDAATPDDDLDGDGFLLADDCFDDIATAFPGATEVCGNGIVDDCDASGTPPRTACYGERPAVTADLVYTGATQDAWAGSAVAVAGDLDDDGVPDLVIGGYGEVFQTGTIWLVSGAGVGTSDLKLPLATLAGESEEDWAGYTVDGGSDLTGDGKPDVVVGAQYEDAVGNSSGAVYLVDGRTRGNVDLSVAHAKILAEDAQDQVGYSVAVAGDVNDDGNADLVLGAIGYSVQGSFRGATYLVYGPIDSGLQFLVDADVLIIGDRAQDNSGCAVAALGDTDGDGVDDVAIGACLNDKGGNNAGIVYVFTEFDTEAEMSVNDAGGVFLGPSAEDHAGESIHGPGDVNGDGYADLLVGAPGSDAGALDAGAAFLIHGPIDSAAPAVAAFLGETAGDGAGSSVAGVGDVDGDGETDFLIGASAADRGGEDAGAAYLVFGPVADGVPLANADVTFVGSAPFDFLGEAVAGLGDTNSDGFDDIAIGSPFYDGSTAAGGAVWLFRFGY